MKGFGFNGLRVGRSISSTGYDPDAQALFDDYPSIPERSKTYYNEIILAFKDAGAWVDGFECLMIYPSENHEERFMRIKSRTLADEIYNGASAYSSPYETQNQRASSKGFNMTLSQKHIKTGLIANDIQNYSSHFRMLFHYEGFPSKNCFFSGAFEGGGVRSSLIANISGDIWMDSSSSSASGRHKFAVASIPAGMKTFNRRSNIDAEMRLNGSVVKSITTNDGALTLIEDYLGCYNNGGTFSSTVNEGNPVLYALGVDGLSDAVMTTLESRITTALTSLNLLETAYDKNFVCDGNSHLVMHWSKIVLGLEQSYGFGLGYRFNNFGVAGQTTAQMSADAGSQIDPLYDAGLDANYLLAFEMTNDYNATGSVATTVSDYETYCEDRTAVGWSVIACGLMARGLMSEAVALDYQSINIDIRDNIVIDGRAVVFVTPPEELFVFQEVGESNADYTTRMNSLTANTTYFQVDRVHLTPAGYKLWSDAITTAVNSI
jgi:hypothetical protein